MTDTPKRGGGKITLDQSEYKELVGKSAKSKRTKNEWRSVFALILLVGFLLIIGFIVVADQVWGGRTDAPTLLAAVGTLISSPLSFAIGHYYGKEQSK